MFGSIGVKLFVWFILGFVMWVFVVELGRGF